MEITEKSSIDILEQLIKNVDLVNIARVAYTLGSQKFKWGKYDNAYWKPNYNKILEDIDWLASNMEEIKDSIKFLYKNRNNQTCS